ncbi:MAG: glycosyltransferase family 4 protein [Actinomycetota bacterium]
MTSQAGGLSASAARRLCVALDVGPLLDPPTGVGRYTRELARNLELVGVDLRRYEVALRGPREATTARWRLPARAVRLAWRHLDRPAIGGLVGGVDVVHGTNFVLPALGGVPGVVTVHDLSYLRNDTFPGGKRLRALVPWSIRRAARVLCPTQAIAAEVEERYAVGASKVVVTHEGVSPVFFGAQPLGESALARLGIAGPFVLAVGTIEPRKNLAMLLEAWRRASRHLRGWTLVLAGAKGWGPELPETPGVVPLGWVGDETLPGLLAAAELFCYPSLYEGFGLPPLEAMAAGTPALVGRYRAVDEVLGEAALSVDPSDPDAIADALVSLVADDNLRRKFVRAGRARASTYTWERTALATARAYREACGR